MLKSQISQKDHNDVKKPAPRIVLSKRARSNSPASVLKKSKSPVILKKTGLERRCQSLSPSKIHQPSLISMDKSFAPTSVSSPEAYALGVSTNSQPVSENGTDVSLPQSVMAKLLRNFSIRKREFMKLRKSFIQQQNSLLEHYATLRDLADRVGAFRDETVGEVKVLSVTGWPAHDLMMLLRDDVAAPFNTVISGIGLQVLQQLRAQLEPIPEDARSIGAQLLARRVELLSLFRNRRGDRSFYSTNNVEWKAKNAEIDQETEKLDKMVLGIVENLKAKIKHCLELSRIPWIDRETLVKKIDRLHKENMALQHKIEEFSKNNDNTDANDAETTKMQALLDELSKEKSEREALKGVVSAAESMLRVARARISTLERQLKETRAELEAMRRKHRDLEQLYRHRESCFDARSKKLLEVSKTGEAAIEALSRQRDALELRVKELHELAEKAEREGEKREADQRARVDELQSKVSEQEQCRLAAENRIAELEAHVKELEDDLHSLHERSKKLLDIEKRKCLDFIPSKEAEPSDRETEIWKELQVVKNALDCAEEEVRQSRADKENLLDSMSRLAQEGADTLRDKMATELLNRERKITKLQKVIDEMRENNKQMEHTMVQYENQLASLRLEVRRLRHYDCYSKDINYQDLQTELLELQMQVESLTRERTALVSAAASRALMLERHERAAELFAKVTRARRQLAAALDGQPDPPTIEDIAHTEISRSLSSMCATAADTWAALRAERARVLRLESAVLAQNLQLEKEGRVRTQLERRRAVLEREVMLAHHRAESSEYCSTSQKGSLIFLN